MKEVIVTNGPKAYIQDSPIPSANVDEVIIKVIVSGSNPKDWKSPEFYNIDGNVGDDIAGFVHAVGQDVVEFKVGDRVAAFHEMTKPGGSYAEFAVAPAHTTFHIPQSISFEEAATLPLAALTSAVGLYSPKQLALPNPWAPDVSSTPIVIYGGASAVGAYAIQFARRSNLHPIIAVAGRGIQFVEGRIDKNKGDTIIDYRQGDDKIVQGITEALKGQKLLYAFDAVSQGSSYINLGKVMSKGGKIVTVLPANREKVPESVELQWTSVGAVHGEEKDLGFVFSRLIGRGLRNGWFQPHPHEVIPGGLEGIEKALIRLKQNKASAVKYVFKVEETPGVGKT